jgi:hypothetical protein
MINEKKFNCEGTIFESILYFVILSIPMEARHFIFQINDVDVVRFFFLYFTLWFFIFISEMVYTCGRTSIQPHKGDLLACNNSVSAVFQKYFSIFVDVVNFPFFPFFIFFFFDLWPHFWLSVRRYKLFYFVLYCVYVFMWSVLK